MKVVGFYTNGTTYEREAGLLMASLATVGMQYEIAAVDDRGSWDENVAVKPQFLLAARERIRGPILYIDVDAFVHENCSAYFENLASQKYDFGAHWFAGPGKGHNFARDNCSCLSGKKCNREHRLLSGTLFFGDTDAAFNLLTLWVGYNREAASVGWKAGGGQRNLWAIVKSQGRHLKQADLPGRYCYVFDKAQGYPKSEPKIIEHTIASRDNRKPRKRPLKKSPRRNRIRELERRF